MEEINSVVEEEDKVSGRREGGRKEWKEGQ